MLMLSGLGILPVAAQKLSLDSCKVYALRNNKKLIAARKATEAASEVKKSAFTNYFPKVNAGALAMRANQGLLQGEIPSMNLPVYDGNPANLPTATEFAYFPGMELNVLDYTNAGFVTAVQPLYMGGRVRYGNKLAALGSEVSEYDLALQSDEILAKTEEYYWNILALEEKRHTLARYKTMLESLEKDVTVSLEAGLVNRSDLLKVTLELNSVQSRALQLENGLEMLKMALAQHIGVAYTDSLEVEKVRMEELPPQAVFHESETALPHRNEYQMLNKAIEAETLQKKMVRGELLPSVAVGVQGLYMDVLDNQNTYGLAFATVSIPISDWWGGSHKIKEHNINIEKAQNTLDEKSELMKLQMEKAYRDMLESYKQISVAGSSVAQAEENMKVVKDNFDAGVLSTSDLLEAQAVFQESKDALVDAKAKYQIKQAYYLLAVADVRQ